MAQQTAEQRCRPDSDKQYPSSQETYFIWASGEEWKSALFQHGCMQMKRCEKQSKHNQHCIRIHSIHKTTTPQHQSFLSSHTHTLSLFFSDHKSKVWKLRAGLWRMEGRNGVLVTAVRCSLGLSTLMRPVCLFSSLGWSVYLLRASQEMSLQGLCLHCHTLTDTHTVANTNSVFVTQCQCQSS